MLNLRKGVFMDIYSVEYSCEKGYCLDCIEIEKNRKKTTEHVRAAIVIIAMVFSMLIIIFDSKYVQAQEIEEVKSLWYIKKDYPLTMNDTSWNEYSLLESIEILNPPEDLLNEMTSEELAQLLLKYPYMWILSTYEYNHIDYYYDFLETNSDIYQVFMLT